MIDTTSFILSPFIPVWYYPYLLSFLGAVHIILSVWMVFEYIVVEIPNFTKDVFFVTFILKLWYVSLHYFLKLSNIVNTIHTQTFQVVKRHLVLICLHTHLSKR